MKGTRLIFRTPRGAQVIPPRATTNLTANYSNGLPVYPYPIIRIIYTNRSDSASQVTYLVTFNQDGELVAALDTVILQPGSSYTQTYEVPGTGLTISVENLSTGDSAVDLLVYGFTPYVSTEQDCCHS